MTARTEGAAPGWFREPGPVAPTDGILAVYLRITAQVLGLAMPLSMMLIVDKVVNQGAVNTLVVLVIGVTLLTCFQYLFLWAQARHNAYLVEALAGPDRRSLYASLLQCAEAPALAGAGWGVLQSAGEEARFHAETRPQMLADAVFVVLLALCMALFNPLLLAVTASFVPLYLWVESRSEIRAMVHSARAASLRDANTGRFFETLAAAELVKSLDLAERMQAHWGSADTRLAAARSRAALVRRGAGLIVELLQRLSVILVMLLGVQAVIAGSMTLGQYIAFNLLSLQLTQPLLRLAGYRRALADRRLRREGRRSVESRCDDGRWPGTGCAMPEPRDSVSLQVRALIPGGPRSMAPVSFSLLGGGRIGVTGPSGVGKSTLLRTLAGLKRPEHGDMHLNGVPLERIDPSALARIIRLVPQKPVLLTASVAENIGLGMPAATPEDIVAAATVCGVTSIVSGWPASFDTVVGPGGKPLSGGEQQRIALARAIVGRPALLLLDEATASLDREAEARLMSNLRRFLPGCALIIVSHRSTALQGVDRVLRLGDSEHPAAPALASV